MAVLYGYLIIASIDFGAGFCLLCPFDEAGPPDQSIDIPLFIAGLGNYQCVFVFFFIGIVGFFPDTAYYYGSAPLIPGSIAIILLAIRGSFYAFENYGSKENIVYLFLYGATGLLIPASLSVALTLSEGGFIVDRGGLFLWNMGRS